MIIERELLAGAVASRAYRISSSTSAAFATLIVRGLASNVEATTVKARTSCGAGFCGLVPMSRHLRSAPGLAVGVLPVDQHGERHPVGLGARVVRVAEVDLREDGDLGCEQPRDLYEQVAVGVERLGREQAAEH